jgi:putative drug exporter of the RND superfamily
MSSFGSKLADVTSDETASFLPEDAESTQVQELLKERFPGGETTLGLIVYRREGGLTQADRRRIAEDARKVDQAIPVTQPAQVPFQPNAPPGLVSENGEAAYTVVTVPLDFDRVADWGEESREIIGGSRDGLEVYVTGDLGLWVDFEEVFGEIDAKLLLATVLLVLVLLGAIYRAPLIAVIPLLVVGLAYQVATGFIYLYAEAGNSVSSNATGILIVLMFGVGTDYCLLLVSRYREELHRVQDKHEAMARALRRAGPAVLASGCTVVAAMLVLLLADTGSTNALGPVSAIGVASALLAGLTLLPALLTAVGRRGFWPRSSAVDCRPEEELERRAGIWRRLGDRVLRRPGLALAATTALFGAFALGLLAYQEDYSINGFFKEEVESVEGFDVLGESFPQGASAPTSVLVQREGGRATDADLAAVRERLQGVDGVAAVSEPQRSEDGAIGKVDVTFEDDPLSEAALARVDALRAAVSDLPGGATALIGAGSAVQQDFNEAAERDLRVIVPVTLLVITIILGILLQAIVAPLVLIATVMASFFGTLGLSIFFFIEVQGSAGVDASLPTFAFIFLVALGVDYTIFLMSRVREEARVHGTREGMLRALSATGPVITSAGLILAGTFAVLMTLPITFTFNIGFMVAVGILLDTFIVRTIMVPAAVELLGDRVWWPSTAKGGGRALREHAEPEAGALPEPARPPAPGLRPAARAAAPRPRAGGSPRARPRGGPRGRGSARRTSPRRARSRPRPSRARGPRAGGEARTGRTRSTARRRTGAAGRGWRGRRRPPALRPRSSAPREGGRRATAAKPGPRRRMRRLRGGPCGRMRRCRCRRGRRRAARRPAGRRWRRARCRRPRWTRR